jgi:hypothetical protein
VLRVDEGVWKDGFGNKPSCGVVWLEMGREVWMERVGDEVCEEVSGDLVVEGKVRGANMGRNVWMERVVMGVMFGVMSWGLGRGGRKTLVQTWVKIYMDGEDGNGVCLVWGLGALVVVGERLF